MARLNDEQLAEPREVELLGPGLVRIPLKTATLPPATRTNSYLVDVGSCWLLVDLGSSDPRELSALAGVIAEVVPEGATLALFLTHHHTDHIDGVGWYAERFGGVVYAGQRTRATLLMTEPRSLQLDWRVMTTQEVTIGDAVAIRTEGHAADHYALRSAGQDLFVGDLISGMGSILVAPPDGDMSAYMRSLERLISLETRSVYPAHGPSSLGSAGRLRHYLQHRRSREALVIKALSPSEARTLDQLVLRVYSDVPKSLHPLARETLLAHLIKVESESLVRRDGQRWALRTV